VNEVILGILIISLILNIFQLIFWWAEKGERNFWKKEYKNESERRWAVVGRNKNLEIKLMKEQEKHNQIEEAEALYGEYDEYLRG